MTLASGFAFNVTQSGDTGNNGNRTPTVWFTTAAFTRSTTYGTSPRNPVVGPGLHTFDLSASKAFRMPYREGREFLFRAS